MTFNKLPANSKKLLDEILEAENPAQMLSERFENASAKEDNELRSLIRELRQGGYISVSWADDVPYHVEINNSARTYEERLAEYVSEKEAQRPVYIIRDQSVKIGDGNTINGSTITGVVNSNTENTPSSDRKHFYDRHPIICSFLISFVAGFILLFSYWSTVVELFEKILKAVF